MTLSRVYSIINETMNALEGVDCLNLDMRSRTINQKSVNEAYHILDKFKDELIRESITHKQKGSN